MKPVTATRSEVVVLGKAVGQREARDYFRDTGELRDVALGALERLARQFDVVVIEGAGSPVELNLLSRDCANLAPARLLTATRSSE